MSRSRFVLVRNMHTGLLEQVLRSELPNMSDDSLDESENSRFPSHENYFGEDANQESIPQQRQPTHSPELNERSVCAEPVKNQIKSIGLSVRMVKERV